MAGFTDTHSNDDPFRNVSQHCVHLLLRGERIERHHQGEIPEQTVAEQGDNVTVMNGGWGGGGGV